MKLYLTLTIGFVAAAVAIGCSSGPQSTATSVTESTALAASALPSVSATATDISAATTVPIAMPDECQARMALFEQMVEELTLACDDEYLYVDADGLSDDTMMVGITAWNQQVPLPQPYSGSNAWRIPLYPSEAAVTTPTNGQGAIGMALNGVPIFDPTQQDGVYNASRDPYLIGELDSCGGHSGRGDDYHYHSGPTCIEDRLSGSGQIVGFALDGYSIRGFHESDGSDPEGLDACRGHSHDDIGYHYHITDEAPYVLGCYHGEVDISIQPRAHRVRTDGQPIQVEITAMHELEDGSTHLEYTYEGVERSVTWIQLNETCWTFTYENPPAGSPGTGTETVCRNE